MRLHKQIISMVEPRIIRHVQPMKNTEQRLKHFLGLLNSHVRSNDRLHAEIVLPVACVIGIRFY